MSDLESAKPDWEEVSILIVDDDRFSIMAIERALKKMNMTNPVRSARDGIEALELLRGEKPEGGMVLPYIILLDLNMPRMNGLEFLDKLRSDPNLRRSVVFMLTTSHAPSDIAQAYDHQVAGYVVKDDLQDTLKRMFEMLSQYGGLVVLPRDMEPGVTQKTGFRQAG